MANEERKKIDFKLLLLVHFCEDFSLSFLRTNEQKILQQQMLLLLASFYYFFFMKNNFHSAISKCDKLLAVSNWIALAQRLLRGMKILYSHF